jgi:ATP-binding cassette, subfamily B, bacterial
MKKNRKINSEQIKTAYKVVRNFLGTHKDKVVAISLVNVLIAVGNGLVPYLMGHFFDNLIYLNKTITFFGFTIQNVLFLLVFLIVMQVTIAIMTYYNEQKNSYLSFLARFEYKITSYSKLIDLPISFHKTQKIGEIRSKIDTASWGFQVLIEQLINSIGTQLLTTVIAIVIIFLMQPTMGIFALCSLVIFLFLSVKPVMKAGNLEQKFYDAWDKSHGNADDALTNIQAVKQSTAEGYEKNKVINGFIKDLIPFWLKSSQIWKLMRFNQAVTITGLQSVIFFWSIYLISQGGMTVGQLISFNAYLGMLFGPFVQLLSMSKTIQSGIININSIEKILETPSEIYVPKNAVVKDIKGDIQFEKVYFGYDQKQQTLKNINLDIKAGEVIALVGESGVGKSTFIDLLSAYNLATSGKVSIDEIDIKKFDLNNLRSQIAIVPQEVVLFNDTITANIKYGNFKATDAEVQSASTKAHASDFIEKFPKKWKQIVGERGIKLSVGQKQRVAIARAILRNPKILILDEPTSALDAKSENIIQSSLEELMQGRTTFIIAHRLSTVRRADKILVFKDGEIVEIGKHDELIQKMDGVYRHLYELQVGLHQ